MRNLVRGCVATLRKKGPASAPRGPLLSIERYYRILLNVKNCSTGKLYGTVPPSVESAFMIM